MDNYTEKLSKRIYRGHNFAMGCLLVVALMVLFGLMFMCSVSK